MKYYRLLILVLFCLITSVFVEGQNMFASSLFTTAYATMTFVLVTGSKYEESFRIDILIGMLLIFSIGFMSTQTLIEMFTNNFTAPRMFKIIIIISLDYAALGFLRLAVVAKRLDDVVGDGRYAIQ